MYRSRAYECAPIRSYHGAERYFQKTKAVRSAKWRSDERPLRRRSQYHYRIQHGTWNGRNFYDLIHYGTTLIRYWEPLENGDEVVSLLYYNSPSSRDFMSAHGWGSYNALPADNGQMVAVPATSHSGCAIEWNVSPHRVAGLPHETFSAHVVFDNNRMVKVAESLHAPVGRYVSSMVDKERRAFLRKEIQIYKDMLTLHFPRIQQHVVLDIAVARPFRSIGVKVGSLYHIEEALKKKFDGTLSDVEHTHLIDDLMGLGQPLYDSLTSRRAWNEGTLGFVWVPNGGRRVKNELPSEMPTCDDLLASFERTLIRAMGWNVPNLFKLANGNGVCPPTSELPGKFKFAPLPSSMRLGSEDQVIASELAVRRTKLFQRLSKV